MSNKIFRCPKCGSDNIQSYEVIYNGGRATQTSTTDGISVGSDFSVGHANTSGSSITHLAETCAPPAMKSRFGCGCLSLIVVLALAAALIHPIVSVIVLIGLYMLYHSMNKDVDNYNTIEFLKIYNDWKNSYYCHRCGNRFILNGDDDS